MSTAKLPDAPAVGSGHPTGMDLPGVLQRIELRLKVLGMSADKAARLAGKPDSIRNMKRAIKDGRTGANANTINALANVLQVKPEWLAGGDKQPARAAIGSHGVQRLIDERNALMEQRSLIDRQIEGLDHALSVLAVPDPRAARSKR